MLDSNHYYSSHAGRYVLQALTTQLQQDLSQIFGYYAIEMGQHRSHVSLLQHSRIKYNLNIYSPTQTIHSPFSMQAEAEFLPIVFDNIDLLISSHLLEQSHYPQQVLREIDRVLMPDGHCFLIGFNPYHYAEMARFLGTKLQLSHSNNSQKIPYHAYPASKICDWLHVLGFEIISTHSYGYRPNFSNQALFKAVHYLETFGSQWMKNAGQVYVIHAKKTEFSKIATNRWQLNKILPPKPTIALASKQGNKQ